MSEASQVLQYHGYNEDINWNDLYEILFMLWVLK